MLARVGGTAGLFSGLLGVGGGFVIVPALDRHTNLDLRSIQATSLSVIALVSVSGIAAAASHGQLPLQAALPFAAASVVGLLTGRQLAPRFSTGLMRRGFAVMAVGVAALVLWRALLGPA